MATNHFPFVLALSISTIKLLNSLMLAVQMIPSSSLSIEQTVCTEKFIIANATYMANQYDQASFQTVLTV